MAENKNAATLVCESQEVLYQRAIKKMNADRLIVQFAYKIENYETAASMFDVVGDYEDARELAEQCRRLAEEAREEEREDKYQKALKREKAASTVQGYQRIVEELDSLGNYRDASERKQECKKSIKKIQLKEKRKTGIAVLILILCVGAVTAGFATGFFQYLLGIGYYQMGFYDRAQQAFEKNTDLLDSSARLEQCREILEKQKLADRKNALKNAKPGESVPFGGNYWRVLERQDDEVLLIMDGVKKEGPLYRIAYDETGMNTEWNASSLRRKLNGEIMEELFTPQEQENLLPADEQENGDYIRVLDLSEAETYQEILQKMSGMDYWVSEQGTEQNSAVFISGSGQIMEYGYPVDSDDISVRPVIRINCVKAAEEAMR